MTRNSQTSDNRYGVKFGYAEHIASQAGASEAGRTPDTIALPPAFVKTPACRLAWRTPVDRVCVECGVAFTAPLGNVQRGRGLFCTRSCQSRTTMRRRRAVRDFRGSGNPNYKGGRSQNKVFYASLYRKRYPDQVRASQKLARAVRSGRIVKPSACQQCRATPSEPLHGHHDDYSQPLSVRWLCRACHIAFHWASRRRGVAA